MAPDLALLQQYVATRDGEALAAIMHQHQGMVYGTCMRILGNNADAEDAAQECFLKLVRNADRVRYSLGGWLHRCATHVSLNVRKQAQARQRREKVYRQAREAELYGDDEWRKIVPYLDRALDELPPRCRYLLVECYLRQRRRTQVAEELRISRVTLYRRLDEAVQLLRRKLRQAGVLTSLAVLEVLEVLLEDHGAVAPPPTLTAQLERIVSAFSRSAASTAPATPPATPRRAKRGSHAVESIGGALAGALLIVGLIVGLYFQSRPRRPSAAPVPAMAPRLSASVAGPAAPAAPKHGRSLAEAVNEIIENPDAAEDEADDPWGPFWMTPEPPEPAPARRAPAKAAPAPVARPREPDYPFAPPDVVAARIDTVRRQRQADRQARQRRPTRRVRRRSPYGLYFGVYRGSVSGGQVITKSRTGVGIPRPLGVKLPRTAGTRLP